MPDVDVTEMPAYSVGEAWADGNLAYLVERYSGKELVTQELRSFLFKEAARRYPSKREDMDNDVAQTVFVAGALKRLTNTMPSNLGGMAAIFEAALEMDAWLGSELAKRDSIERLKERPASWWRTKLGDGSPNDVVNALSTTWWDEVGGKQSRSRTSKWEVLIYTAGSREMLALETAQSITRVVDGQYVIWRVEDDESSIEVMAEDVREGPILIQRRGGIVG